MSPQVGWKCDKDPDALEGDKPFTECISCSKTDDHCGFTPEMLILMSRFSGSHPLDPLRPSITQVMRECVRSTIIQAFFDYYVPLRKNWNTFRGNLVHQFMDGVHTSDSWNEISNERKLWLPDAKMEITITGKADKIIHTKKIIRDYKTTARIPSGDEPQGSHTLQLNGYRWLWWPVLQAEKLRIQYVDMRGTKQIKVPLMPLEEVEQHIVNQAETLVPCLLERTIPPGTFDPKNWKCRYCDISDICREVNELEGEVNVPQGNKEDTGNPHRTRRESPKLRTIRKQPASE